MRKTLFACACLICFSLAGFAQSNDAYFGYSHLTGNHDGWNADLNYGMTRHVQIAADLGGYYDNGDNVHSFMVGAKVTSPTDYYGVRPWGRLLLGVSHVSPRGFDGDSGFSWALGGGVDKDLTKRVGVRVSAEAFHTNFYDYGDTHFRGGLGVFYRF